MAKAKAKARKRQQEDPSIGFVGDVIKEAIAQLERKRAGLPFTARAAVKSAIVQLNLTSKITRTLCGRTWFGLTK